MNPLNGLLLVDKPTGLTSHDVVYRARRTLGTKAIGHAGTLDPLASGLLILLVGEATKVSDYLLNGDKSYECTVRLGVATDSMDITGVVLAEKPVEVTEERVREVVTELTGVLSLEVPVHSAVKVDGKKLYEFAHKGERPESVPVREMNFFKVDVVSIALPSVVVRLSCSKGSFIRAWANRFGEVLGCGGTVETLRRVASSPFTIESGITLDDLGSKWEARAERAGFELGPAWVPLRDSLPHFRRIDIAGQDERLMMNGQISGPLRSQLLPYIQIGQHPPPVRVIARETQDLLALLVAEPGEFYRIKRVFHRA